MSMKKQIAKIEYHTDDETGINYVGELDCGFDEVELRKYIEIHKEKGTKDLLEMLAYMICQVKKIDIESQPKSCCQTCPKCTNGSVWKISPREGWYRCAKCGGSGKL